MPALGQRLSGADLVALAVAVGDNGGQVVAEALVSIAQPDRLSTRKERQAEQTYTFHDRLMRKRSADKLGSNT